MRTRRGLAIALLVASGLLPAIQTARAAPGCDWPMYGRDPGRSFATEPGCSALSTTTAPTLRTNWVLPTSAPVTASPAVVDGMVYVGDWAGTFYAVPAGSAAGAAAPRWRFRIDDTSGVAFGRIVSSAAVTSIGARQVVLFGGGATLYALDALTGSQLDALCLDPRDIGAARCRSGTGQVEIESSPAVVTVGGGERRALVGLDVHNDANVGRTGVVAVALRPVPPSGVQLVPIWKFDPEAADVYTGADLLTRGSGTGSGCGGVWSSPAVDVERGVVVFGTASCSVDGVRSGEHMWALDMSDGKLLWSFGPPRESTRLDDDFGASPNILPGGLVGEGSKDGWYYALRIRPSGATPDVVWRTHVGQAGHVNTDFAVGGIIGTPATGMALGEPAIFVTTALSTPVARPLDHPAGPTPDTTLAQDPQRLFSLTALRASDGAVLWRSPLARPSYGAPSFANGVVLVPTTFAFALNAFDADSGVPLTAVPVGGAPSSSPVAVGSAVFMGVGTSETDLEFKAFGADAVSAITGLSSPLAPFSGIYSFSFSNA